MVAPVWARALRVRARTCVYTRLFSLAPCAGVVFSYFFSFTIAEVISTLSRQET